jgi:hypothetical protein
MRLHIILNPDGTQGGEAFGLLVLVQAPTGVVYAHQCEGRRTAVRAAEGFLVPVTGLLGGPVGDDAPWPPPFVTAAPSLAFFDRTFGGDPPDPQRPQYGTWTEAQLRELAGVVAQVPYWTGQAGTAAAAERVLLALDTDRVAELTEAWVPVRTPHGPGSSCSPTATEAAPRLLIATQTRPDGAAAVALSDRRNRAIWEPGGRAVRRRRG